VRRRNPACGKGEPGQELRLLRARQLDQAQHHELLGRAITRLLQPLGHDQHREGTDRPRSGKTKDFEGTRRISARHPPWALPH
jgi:hypothetical protein